MGRYYMMGIEFQCGMMKNSEDRYWWRMCNNMNVLTATELYS